MGKCVDDAAFLLQDLKENGPQCSWDWPADLRFAKHAGDANATELYEWAVESTLVLPLLLYEVQLRGRYINQRRLRALRLLVRTGKVKSHWGGMGENGVYYFGVNRTRVYSLADAVLCQIG
jgi:hypothetical protein